MSQGTYIPEDQRDSAWWIWNKKFTCRIPYLQSMSTDYIRQFGVMVSGDPVRDKAIVSETITTMLTIAQMVEYFSKGVTVGVVKYEDTKPVLNVNSSFAFFSFEPFSISLISVTFTNLIIHFLVKKIKSIFSKK